MLIRALLVVSLAFAVGCSHLRVREDAPFPVAAQASSLPPSATQTLHARFGNHELALQCAFAADSDGWRSVCIGPAGRRLLTITIDGNRQLTAQVDPALPAAFDPARMAVDIQWAFWPLEALEAATRNTQWRVTEASTKMRKIHFGNRLIADIHYADADPWNGRLSIVHQTPGYRLDLVTLTPRGR